MMFRRKRSAGPNSGTMHDSGFLGDVLILLAALLLFVPLAQWLRIGSVLAYLAAGLVVGPDVLGLITNVDAALRIGEFGVVFLLFAVGLELKVERLRLFRLRSFILAGSQVVVTAVVVTTIAWGLGLTLIQAFLVGGALSFSSTAVALQVLGERTAMTRPLGRSALAILLVQDALVGPMLVYVSVAARGDSHLGLALGEAALKSLMVVALIVLGERLLLRPVFRLAAGAGQPEVFTGATLLLVLGVGWATENAGLSMALGAFLAGLMVADTEFRHQVAADIQPFRGLFLGLFFMAVGMSIDLSVAGNNAAAVVFTVVTLIAVKAVIIAGLALALRVPRERALALAGLLSQGSEFAFVLFGFAAAAGVLPDTEAQILTVAVGLSMVVTAAGGALVRLSAGAREAAPSALGKLDKEGGDLAGHVVIAGFGQVGMAVARHLATQRIPLVVLDLSPRRVAASRARSLPVFYGNATRLDVLRAARVDRAQALVVAVPDADIAEEITEMARAACPRLKIFVRVPDADSVRPLQKAGANAVAIDGLTTALELAERVVLIFAIETERDDPGPPPPGSRAGP